MQLDGPAQHEAVQRLLPWHLNGTLGSVERVRVEKHLAECPLCQSDLEEQRELMQALDAPHAAGSAEQGFAGLMRRLDEDEQSAAGPRTRAAGVWSSPHFSRWFAVAAVAQCAAIALLAVVLHWPVEGDGPYRTLSAAMPVRTSGDQLVVAFHDDASLGEMRRALSAVGGRIVDGPTADGVLVIAVPPGSAGPAVTALRAQLAVRLAESLVLARPR
ncbi:MAG: zf-HC2 domain-containing protein [Pseudomonadota bacterium]|nr:zf-HC2 domain-containing protein [Pseudomonadota bacterium]